MSVSGSGVSYHELAVWLFFAVLLILGIVAARFWTGRAMPSSGSTGTSEATADRQHWREALQSMQDRSELEGRVQTVEQAMEHVPSSTDFAELKGTVSVVQAQQEAQSERLKMIGATVYRIEDFLLKGNRP